MPAIGNQPVRAATKTSSSDVSSGGIDNSSRDVARITEATRPPRRLPATMPSGRPTAVASSSAATARIAVLAARSAIIPRTGRS